MNRWKALKKRRDERGAALIEAVVVIPFFILIFVCIIFVGKIYAEKERAMRTSKERAWTAAMSSCSGKDVKTGSDGSPTLTGVNTNDARHASGAPGTDRMSRSYGSVISDVSYDVRADLQLGGYTKSMKSRTKVMCNEVAEDGDLLGVLRTAYRSLTGI